MNNGLKMLVRSTVGKCYKMRPMLALRSIFEKSLLRQFRRSSLTLRQPQSLTSQWTSF